MRVARTNLPWRAAVEAISDMFAELRKNGLDAFTEHAQEVQEVGETEIKRSWGRGGSRASRLNSLWFDSTVSSSNDGEPQLL